MKNIAEGNCKIRSSNSWNSSETQCEYCGRWRIVRKIKYWPQGWYIWWWSYGESLRNHVEHFEWQIYFHLCRVVQLCQVASVQMKLVASKTRVTPIKKQVIPCLELLGATILAWLASTVINALQQQINHMIYWVDSRTVLCWIKNGRQWKQYVHHRVEEIRFITWKADWNYCPGNVNPADLPSWGLTGHELQQSPIWSALSSFTQRMMTTTTDEWSKRNHDVRNCQEPSRSDSCSNMYCGLFNTNQPITDYQVWSIQWSWSSVESDVIRVTIHQ